MTKSDAIRIFGTRKGLAAALGISPQAIGQWPDILSQRTSDEVVGAALRTGSITPEAAVSMLAPQAESAA